MLKNFLNPLNILLLVVGIAGVHLVRPALVPYYPIGLPGVILFLGLVYLIFHRPDEKFFVLQSQSQVSLLFLAALLGTQLLGGITHSSTISVLLLICILTGLSASMEQALWGFGSFLFSLGIFYTGIFSSFLPFNYVTPPSGGLQQLFPPMLTAFPVFLISLLAGHKRYLWLLKKDYQSIKDSRTKQENPGNPQVFSPKSEAKLILPEPRTEEMGPEAAKAHMSQAYINRQNQKSLQDMKSVLESVVYFMSKNFKAYSALGFLYNDGTKTLHLNAVISKSSKLIKDVTIPTHSGLIGDCMNSHEGFITGDLKNYESQLEYYREHDGVNSVLAIPILQPESRRKMGALVVDSQNLRAFSDESKELLRRFTHIAGAMISNVWLTRQVSVQAKWADTLYEVTRALTKVQKVEDVMGRLMDALPEIFTHDRIIVCVYNSKIKKGQVWNVLGETGGIQRGMEFEIKNERSLYGAVFTRRTEILMENFPENHRGFFRFSEALDDSMEKPADLMIVPLFDDNQAVVAVIGVESGKPGSYSDKELKSLNTLMVNFSTALGKARAYGELEKLATIDGLTQISNHRKFQDWLSTEMHRTQRYKEQLTLLLMDIDHFKNFNDTYGHTVGDQVLKSVAQTIQKTIRGFDLVARYGGEEFVVVMIKSDEKASRVLAERICKTIEAMKVLHEGKVLQVTVSIGSSTFPQDVQTKQDLIEAADQAMYFSKENGRNQVTYFADVRDKLERKSG